MGLISNRIIKLLFLVLGVTVISTLLLPPLSAQNGDDETDSETPIVSGCNNGGNSDQYLYCIMQNTYGTLQNVMNLPTYLENLTNLAYAWLTDDDSDTTATLQSGFANYGNAVLADINSRNALQPQILSDLFTGSTSSTLPNANDLSYQTLLNMPFYSQDPRNPPGQNPPPYNAPYNYVKNASGINISHVIPGTNWTGKTSDQNKYGVYYNTVMSVESYSGYILSGLYADYENGNGLSTMQTTLLTQATSSDWFSQIASERIGIVMRQLLMFQSQAFVLMTQILGIERQMLSAQTMTNTLLVLLNGPYEQTLLQKASGTPAAP